MSLKVKERISVLKEDGLFSLVIYPVRDKLKLNLLFGWLILWTFCGIFFVTTLINYSQGPRLAEIEYIEAQEKIKDPVERQKAIDVIKAKLDKNQQQRMILMILIAFWGYYEFKVGRAYFFRKFGFEKVWIKNGVIYYRKEINKRGRTKKFNLEFVNEFTPVDYNKYDFFQNMSRSFWTLAGESIEFSYHSKIMRFGIQLTEREAKEVSDQLNKTLRKLRHSAEKKEVES